MIADDLQFVTELPERAADEPALVIDVEGFEGPLDLLLTLARQQKVDLAKISILALADQYLAFIEVARKLRLELAADYLVMAAWLAYLKSRLLLPEQPAPDGLSAEEMANALAQRLRRLEAIRRAADALGQRARLGRDMFLRGAAEGVEVSTRPKFEAQLYDLLTAYARQRQKTAVTQVTLQQRAVWSLAEARGALERLVGVAREWMALDDFLIQFCLDAPTARTVRASAFSASLEMAREGRILIRQDRAFAPLWVKRGETPPLADAGA